jgi:hypothetical protein
MFISGCLNWEQEAYDFLRNLWSRVPQNIQQICTERADETGLSGEAGVGRSYDKLRGCVLGLMSNR